MTVNDNVPTGPTALALALGLAIGIPSGIALLVVTCVFSKRRRRVVEEKQRGRRSQFVIH